MSQETIKRLTVDQEKAAASIGMLVLRATGFLGEDPDDTLENDSDWARTKANFPEFEGKIDELRKAVRRVRTSQILYEGLSFRRSTEIQMKASFVILKDQAAVNLLSTILWNRSIGSDQGFVQTQLTIEQLGQMHTELRTSGYPLRPDLEFRHVIATILTGGLKIERPAVS